MPETWALQWWLYSSSKAVANNQEIGKMRAEAGVARQLIQHSAANHRQIQEIRVPIEVDVKAA